MKQGFIEFLKENGIYTEFESYMLSEGVFNSMEDYINITIERGCNLFSSAFNFCDCIDCNELNEKWYPLWDKWREIIKD